jgi:hypothetical protein
VSYCLSQFGLQMWAWDVLTLVSCLATEIDVGFGANDVLNFLGLAPSSNSSQGPRGNFQLWLWQMSCDLAPST